MHVQEQNGLSLASHTSYGSGLELIEAIVLCIEIHRQRIRVLVLLLRHLLQSLHLQANVYKPLTYTVNLIRALILTTSTCNIFLNIKFTITLYLNIYHLK